MFALIQNGNVVQVEATEFPVSSLLQWVDCTSTPNVVAGWTYNGTTFVAPVVAAPTLAQQALVAANEGVIITSTATPALNATYACDATAQSRLTAIQTRINAGLGLPLGNATIGWIDMAGNLHQFTAAQFTSFAHVISDYVYELLMLEMGGTGSLPSNNLTIP